MASITKSNPKQGGCTSLTPLPLTVVLAAVDVFPSALLSGGAEVG